MRGWPFPARDTVWVGWTLAAVVATTTFPLTAFGAERVVLGEYFTWLG